MREPVPSSLAPEALARWLHDQAASADRIEFDVSVAPTPAVRVAVASLAAARGELDVRGVHADCIVGHGLRVATTRSVPRYAGALVCLEAAVAPHAA